MLTETIDTLGPILWRKGKAFHGMPDVRVVKVSRQLVQVLRDQGVDGVWQLDSLAGKSSPNTPAGSVPSQYGKRWVIGATIWPSTVSVTRLSDDVEGTMNNPRARYRVGDTVHGVYAHLYSSRSLSGGTVPVSNADGVILEVSEIPGSRGKLWPRYLVEVDVAGAKRYGWVDEDRDWRANPRRGAGRGITPLAPGTHVTINSASSHNIGATILQWNAGEPDRYGEYHNALVRTDVVNHKSGGYWFGGKERLEPHWALSVDRQGNPKLPDIPTEFIQAVSWARRSYRNKWRYELSHGPSESRSDLAVYYWAPFARRDWSYGELLARIAWHQYGEALVSKIPAHLDRQQVEALGITDVMNPTDLSSSQVTDDMLADARERLAGYVGRRGLGERVDRQGNPRRRRPAGMSNSDWELLSENEWMNEDYDAGNYPPDVHPWAMKAFQMQEGSEVRVPYLNADQSERIMVVRHPQWNSWSFRIDGHPVTPRKTVFAGLVKEIAEQIAYFFEYGELAPEGSRRGNPVGFTPHERSVSRVYVKGVRPDGTSFYPMGDGALYEPVDSVKAALEAEGYVVRAVEVGHRTWELTVHKGSRRGNPDTRDLKDIAFNAGKSWGSTGSWDSGVSNANVRHYGFVRWWNDLDPGQAYSRDRQKKTTLERAFNEGYAIGRKKPLWEGRKGNPKTKSGVDYSGTEGDPHAGGRTAGVFWAGLRGIIRPDYGQVQTAYYNWLKATRTRKPRPGGPNDTFNEFRAGFKEGYEGGHKINPDSSAAKMYESFHGKPSEAVIEVPEEVHYHEHLAALGDLTEIVVRPARGGKYLVLGFQGTGVILSSNEEGTQMYLIGGDQSLDLGQLGLKGNEADKESVLIGTLHKITYKTRKGFDKFELFDYEHKLGEETGQQPVLIYDTMNNLMSISGGAYKVKPEGIVN